MNALLVFLILIICVGAVSASEDVSTDDTVNGINTEPAVIDQGSTFNEIDNNNDNNLKEANEDSNIVSSGNGYIGDSSDDSENHIIDISENSKSSMNKLSSSKLGEGNVIYLKPNAKNGDGFDELLTIAERQAKNPIDTSKKLAYGNELKGHLADMQELIQWIEANNPTADQILKKAREIAHRYTTICFRRE